MTKKEKGGYISVSHQDKNNSFKQEFKGEVFDKPTTFPRGLGAEHPFEFDDLEKLYKKYGVLAGAINKMTDSIVTDFKIKLKNPNAQVLVDDFLHETNFHTVVSTWVREGLLKGNGFIEIDLDKTKVRVMNANTMYVKRNKKGKVLEYNQWTKPLNKFVKDSKDLIPFKPNQIAHLPINKIPNDPYGIGIVWSNERVIENLIKNEQDLQVLVTRKSGQPYHIKVGQPGVVTPKAIVDQIKQNLQFLTNTHEWVTDGDIEITAIDFKGLTNNLTDAQMYFFRMLLAGLEIPEVMMGSGQLNEGIAKVQLKTYGRKIKSIQNLVADIIEEKIIRPLLIANSLDERPLFIWELPDEEDISARLTLYREFLNTPSTPELKASIEIKIAELLEDEQLLAMLRTPQQAKDEFEVEAERLEREREESEIPQPEVPGAKPAAQSNELDLKEFVKKQGNKWCVFSEEGRNFGCFPTKSQADKRLAQIKRFSKNNLSVKEWVDLKELAGFNYTDYLIKILEVLRNDPFADLIGKTEKDFANGLLTKTQVEKLRVVLKDGFKENQTIAQIEKNVQDSVNLKDRVTRVGVIKASVRPNMIARTETVRLANQGLVNLYKENGIEKVSFLAALSDRTCPICEGLNGQVFNINELVVGVNQPQIHTNCRCTLVSVIE